MVRCVVLVSIPHWTFFKNRFKLFGLLNGRVTNQEQHFFPTWANIRIKERRERIKTCPELLA